MTFIHTFYLYLIPNFILMVSVLYSWHKLLNKKINFKDPKLYITLIGLVIISILNYIISEKFIRVIIITIIFMFFIKFLFKENIQKCVITPIFYQLLVFFSESIYAIFIVLIFGENFSQFLNTIVGLILTNSIIGILSIFLSMNKFIRKIYLWLISVTEKIKNVQLISLSCFILVILNIFNAAVYFKIDFINLLIINVILISVFAVIIVYTLKTQNNFITVSDKYNVAIKSLNDYEVMMTKYRVANHENKNLLLTVRAMIINNEKDIPKYIDSIVEEKFEDDEKLLFKMAIIPTGGLRATIYSNILKIKDNGIKYDLIIDRKIKIADLIELDTTTTIDICKIIGVFIDNAIDETKKMKAKNIIIELYFENHKFYIKISNYIKNKIEVDKIYEEGYTTKKEGHGYGLSLVKNIVKSNSLLENYVEINKKVISQILIININNYKK